MKRLEGKNVVVTGGARGQGRSHVVRCAAEGANVVAIDITHDVPTISYPMASRADLDETVDLASRHGTQVLAYVADVRDGDRMKSVIDEAAQTLGGIDAISINAGVATPAKPVADIARDAWEEQIGINLTGAFVSAQAVIPHLKERGAGAIVFTASVAGAQGMPNLGAYVASKHGVLGLMRTLAIELGPESIRSNALMPTSVPTPMLVNDDIYRIFRPDLESPALEDLTDLLVDIQLLPIPYVEVDDISNALVWLLSDEARYVTGVALPVDGGALLR